MVGFIRVKNREEALAGVDGIAFPRLVPAIRKPRSPPWVTSVGGDAVLAPSDLFPARLSSSCLLASFSRNPPPAPSCPTPQSLLSSSLRASVLGAFRILVPPQDVSHHAPLVALRASIVPLCDVHTAHQIPEIRHPFFLISTGSSKPLTSSPRYRCDYFYPPFSASTRTSFFSSQSRRGNCRLRK